MTDLIACLTTGKGTWIEVLKVINSEEWEHIFLITNNFGKEKFKHDKAELIVINDSTITNMSKQIYENLKSKIKFNDVAVNLISGTGKEHMALITAVLKLGVGVRFVTEENGKVKEI